MKQVYTIYDEIYNIDIVLFIGTTKQADAYLDKMYPGARQDLSSSCDGYFMLISGEGCDFHFVYIDRKPENVSEWVTLSHEINHVAFSTMRTVGVKDEEAHCYYHDYLFKKTMATIKQGAKND